MTVWLVPRSQSSTEADLYGYLRWNLGTNLNFTKQGTNTLACHIRTVETIRDVSGDVARRAINLQLDLRYSVNRRAGRLVVSGPNRTSMHRAVTEKYRDLGEKSQQALLPQLFENLTRIPAIHQVMTPLRAFVLHISDNNELDLTDRALRRYEPRKTQQYVNLLKALGYVRSEGDKIVPAGLMTKVKASYGSGASIVPRILADALKEASGYMVDILGWRLMVPYIRWSNAYYWKALEADNLPRISMQSWNASHLQFYGSPTHGNPRTQIDDMVRANIVSYEKEGFEGVREVFEPYRKQALRMPIVKEVLLAS